MAKNYDILGQLDDEFDEDAIVEIISVGGESRFSMCDVSNGYMASMHGTVKIRCKDGYIPISLNRYCNIDCISEDDRIFRISYTGSSYALIAFIECVKFRLDVEEE